MSGDSYLALDLGASSGRALIGTLDGGRLQVEEVHRFPNPMVELNGHLHWNAVGLFEEVKASLRACMARECRPASMGVDTWGIDFGLLDRSGELVGLPFCYRDARTTGMIEAFEQRVPRSRIYELTGVQFLPFNTLYQLHAMVQGSSPALEIASDLLFMPDLMNYFLTGRKATEFTIASTSQLCNPRTRDWEPELLEALALPRSIMPAIHPTGGVLGPLSEGVSRELGMQLPVVATASHDTAAAVAAVPAEGRDWAYISSGTWSPMGVEHDKPLISEQTLALNITNEAGVGGFRVLKNITGLWLLEQCRRAWNLAGSYAELLTAAAEAEPFKALLYPDAPIFLNPPNMPEAITGFCRATGQAPPESAPEVARMILESLALRYRTVCEELQQVYPFPINRLHIIGGGARNELLCQFTADATGRPVIAGPAEATAIGNTLVQAMAMGAVRSVDEMRRVVSASFPAVHYEPTGSASWDRAYDRFLELAGRT